MLAHIEKSKEATRKLLKLINEFSKVAGYKIITEIISAFEKQHRHNSVHAMRNFKLGHLKDQI